MLNAKYVIAPSLEMCFRDKTTGLPLRDGWVFAYKDNARTIPKTFYTLTGSPGSYTYTPLPNPCQLTGIGTFSDGNGNDVLPYWLPFISADSEEVDLYYIVVTDVNKDPTTPQFVRQAWPNFISTGGEESVITENFVPNGQFWLHNAIASSLSADPVTNPIGKISLPVTQIAPGGWTFERPSDSKSTDIVNFPKIGSYVDNPSASPRYSCQVVCSNPSSADGFKYLAVKFWDVNKFSTPVSVGQVYTFAISGIVNAGSSLPVTLYLVKNFGVGGSSFTPVPLTTFAFDNTGWKIQYFSFSFGNNTGYTIGSSGDYVQLALGLPTNQAFNASFTDAILVSDNVIITTFPETTNDQFNALSLAGFVPVQIDNSNIGLPVIRTLEGFGFDKSQIGKIYPSFSTSPGFGELPTNVDVAYITNTYSPEGIPYSRLKAVLFDGTNYVPSTGTGTNYMTAILTATAQIILTQNNSTQAGYAINGGISTGFAFNQSTVNTNTGIATAILGASQPYSAPTNLATILETRANTSIQITAIGPGPGFTGGIQTYRAGSPVNPTVGGVFIVGFNQVPSVLAGPPGKYFNIVTNIGGWYVWYALDGGTSSDPGPIGGQVGVKVSLNSLDTFNSIAQKTANAMNQLATTSIVCIAAASMTPGCYFTIVTAQGAFAIWYQIGGVGTAPVLSNTTLINVPLTGSEDATTVATKTVFYINSYQFAGPYLNGQFIRARDSGAGIDANKLIRYSYIPGYGGDITGTYEWDDVLSHNHTTNDTLGLGGSGSNSFAASGSFTPTTVVVNYRGESENTVKNISMNFYIKY